MKPDGKGGQKIDFGALEAMQAAKDAKKIVPPVQVESSVDQKGSQKDKNGWYPGKIIGRFFG
jgi:hypothetical protein